MIFENFIQVELQVSKQDHRKTLVQDVSEVYTLFAFGK